MLVKLDHPPPPGRGENKSYLKPHHRFVFYWQTPLRTPCAFPLLLAERSIKYNVNGRTCRFLPHWSFDLWTSPKLQSWMTPPRLWIMRQIHWRSNPPNRVVSNPPVKSIRRLTRHPLPCSSAIGCVSKDSPFCKRQSKVKRTFVAPAESAISKKSSNLSCLYNGSRGSMIHL